MKRQTARDILTESFRELAEKKNIDKITVREITENCDYSTATFYRQFKDKYDLIAWAYTRDLAGLVGKIGKDGFTWEMGLLEAASYFLNQREYLANLLLHTSGQDSFIRYMTEIHHHSLSRLFRETTGESEVDQKTEMYIRLYCLGTVNLTCECIFGKFEVTADDLAEVYDHSLPAPLRDCFFGK